jgi:mannose/fructose-specific phosphotransferase system component IIA
MATAVLASHLGERADAVRERVEAAVAGALKGVQVVEVPPGSSADEMLEQVALHAAMDFMFGELNPAR